MRRRYAFTLIELLVVIAIIALLMSILMPALSAARSVARRAKCLSNVRNMQVANWMYLTSHDGRLIDVGLAHGGAHAHEEAAWINTLSGYYGSTLLHRSPVDNSPHWPADEGGQGVPVPGGDGTQFRRTSYGINNFLSGVAPSMPGTSWQAYTNLEEVPNPAETVHFLIMAFTGPFAGADHVHVENWMPHPDAPPVVAASQMQTNAHGGPEKSWESVSNYGFLDGHARTLTFEEVFQNWTNNRFDPQVAR